MDRIVKKQRERELLRRINAAGIPVALRTQHQEIPPVLVRQDVDAYDAEVFDLNEGAGLILPLKLVSDMPVFCFMGFAVVLDRWRQALFSPLEEVEDLDWPRYEFAGKSNLKFNRDEVINRFIRDANSVRPGYPMCGLALAFSTVPMPDDLRCGEALDGVIQVYDQFDRKHSADIRLRVQREVIAGHGLKRKDA